MSIHDDPPEHTGTTTSGALADPKGGRATTPAAPVPTEAVKKPGSHPKVAIQRPKRELAEAQAALASGRVELLAATSDHRAKELGLNEATANFLRLYPSPSSESVVREHLAKDAAERLKRVQAGLPANPATVYQGDQSPLSLAALARGHRPSTSLRSTTIRRRI